ncbi:TetR/AcrR family transcriptional regulator [Nonomuraea roseoviolacea]|uniref:AcrR family transcriptional regulator n=1 Tax=Nonomuraea roseoviolacea subsp. carminata TaxID=160689 RepID=A0ABT1KET8_9ACTN|nr:TetR/AcrR family transcriptional regulator [Nonomuraea roseoviolacea]MCP2352532.1 AcrR family transcriptional regulator [Nonomuraea roseoviolacea subsp. carminata]
MTDQRGPGRPRSEAARQAILNAAMLDLDEHGYAALTMQGIAARAGVGKQTVYRWWSSKADVVLEALIERAEQVVVAPDAGTLEGDLDAFLTATFREHGLRRVLTGLMAQALLDPEFAKAFRDRFLFSRRAALRQILDRAAARGEIPADVDRELLIDMVYGLLWYRLMLDHAPLGEPVGRQLTGLLLRAVSAPPPGTGAASTSPSGPTSSRPTSSRPTS